MIFNSHSNLVGAHALLSPSNYHWVNKTDEEVLLFYNNYSAAQRGTALHELAHQLITLGVHLPKNKKTLNSFVNDAIGYKMNSEQPLFYTENCFGTADAISFDKSGLLRIHDLKTGKTPASIMQLRVYAAIFCLEYKYSPKDIDMELRIYQSDEIIYDKPEIPDIVPIIDRIITADKLITRAKEEENSYV